MPIELEGIGLAAAAVQGGHLGDDEPFTPWKFRGQWRQIRHDPFVQPHGELGLGPLLQSGQPQLTQPAAEPVTQLVVDHVGQQRAAPEPQRLVVAAHPLPGIAGDGGLPDEGEELLRVDHMGAGIDGVAVVPGLDVQPMRCEAGSQPADVGVDGAAGRGGAAPFHSRSMRRAVVTTWPACSRRIDSRHRSWRRLPTRTDRPS